MWCLEIGYGQEQGDADFLRFMKVDWSHNYANEISSHVWNIF